MSDPQSMHSQIRRILADTRWVVDEVVHGVITSLPEQPSTTNAPLDLYGAMVEVARRLQVFAPVSCCELTDATGVNHCGHEPPLPVPRRVRLRWWLGARWAALRLRLGSWVAGVDLDEGGCE